MQAPTRIILSTLLAMLVSLLWISPEAGASGPSTITKGSSVAFEYTLTVEGGNEILDSNVGGPPLTYKHGAGEIIPGLEKAMEGMKVGESKHVVVAPEDAYGPVIEQAIIKVEKEKLPAEVRKAGSPVMLNTPDGRSLRGVVTEVGESEATVDFNHPLAGKTLVFDVKIVEIK